MIKKNLAAISLIAAYAAIILIAGCIPEDSLQWSKDGSRGLYSKDGALFIVDGATGSLIQVAAKQTTTPWPAISQDGTFIAYGQVINVGSFNDALKLLPSTQTREIRAHAEVLKRKILRDGLINGNLPPISKTKDSFNQQHINWVHRYLVENADDALAGRIGEDLIKKIRQKELKLYQLVAATVSAYNTGKVLATSSQMLWRIRFSPDSKLIAYVTDRAAGKTFEAGFDLYVVSQTENIPAVFVEPATAIGYDFRPDSKAIAYTKPVDTNFDNKKFILGSLVERTIVKPTGEVFASPAAGDGSEFPTVYTCTGPVKELAGVVYYSCMFLYYARDNRIFFSSAKMSFPSSKLDTEKGTVFCYDPITGAVGEVLHQTALDFTQGNFYLFTPSLNSRKILLPGNKNTLGVYLLGQDINSSKIVVDANEGFSDNSPPKLVAAWKGAEEFSCLVSQDSHFLTNNPNTPYHRKEIVIFDAQGNIKQVLSRNWHSELLEF
jgi:hypothetical protein